MGLQGKGTGSRNQRPQKSVKGQAVDLHKRGSLSGISVSFTFAGRMLVLAGGNGLKP